MLIHLLRHADASEENQYNDNDRPLTVKGVNQAETVGKFLQSKKINIDTIISSPLKRENQTAEIIKEILGLQKIITNQNLSVGNGVKNLIGDIIELNKSSMLLVGHAPYLSDLLFYLIADKDDNVVFKKCTLTSIETDSNVSYKRGKLIQVKHPSEMLK